MSGPQAQFGIQITADDKTAKGAKSAEKRIGQIPKRAGDVSKKSQGLLGTLGKVEEASAKAFGGKSITSGLTKRLSAIKEAASAAGTGLGEAATAGSTLSTVMTGMGVVAAGTIGVLAAAGYAAFKLADGWAQGAASIGRTAATIGVATKALQEFQAAGERAGVDKGASTGALGGIAQTFNDARYGRNQEAMALMMRLGIKPRNGADGQLDTIGMTQDLADAISRQKNAQTRRMIASKFGISDAALPMFLNGGGAIRSDMADADSTALVLSDDDIAKGKRIARKGAIVSQMKDRAVGMAGSAAADGQEAGYDGIIGGARGGVAAAGHAIERGSKSILEAAKVLGSAVASTVGSLGGSPAFAEAIRSRGERSKDWQVSPKGARSSMQVMPYTAHHPGFGIKPAANDSTTEYDRVGREYANALLDHYGGDWALASAAYNAGPGAVDRWIKRFGDPRKGQISDADWIAHIPGNGKGSYQETRDYASRVTGAEQRHVHEIHIHDNRVTVKTRGSGSSSPAISTASVGQG